MMTAIGVQPFVAGFREKR